MQSGKGIRFYVRCLAILALTLAVTSALVSNVSIANADDEDHLELKGLIDSRPDVPTDENWVVNGETFMVDENTIFEGDLAVGTCAEVEYVETDSGLLALKIKSESDDDCGDETGDEESGDEEEPDELELKGLIDSRPDNPTDEDWVVNGEIFMVDENTVFEGDLAVGTCAEVEYVETDGGLLALKIKSESDDDCGDETGDEESGDEEEPDELELKGLIDSRPDNPTDEDWVVNGETFMVDENTVFEGDLAVGTCAEVEYVETDSGLLALKIKSESDDDCGDETGDEEPGDEEPGDEEEPDELELKGLIDSRPDVPTDGDWVVNGETFMVDENTAFEGDLAVGTCAEVEYVETDSGLLALKIKADDDCDGEEPDDEEEENSKVFFGWVKNMPEAEEGLAGPWQVGERSVIANEETIFMPTHGPFDTDVCVKVKYQEPTDEIDDIAAADESEEVIAVGLQTQPESVCAKGHNQDERDDHYGRIDGMPEEGVNNTWIIDGAEYQQTEATEFETEYGDFEIGVCVEFKVDEENPTILTKVETERDYKCKDEGKEHPDGVIFGVVEIAPDGLLGEWTVGDHVFVSDESTIFKLQNGPAEEGVTVKIKFYIDEDGVNRALEIQSKYMKEKEEDEDGDGFRQGIEGKVYGTIQEFPDGKIGKWLVSGVTYRATDDTQFEEEDGPFAKGAKVKIEYVVSSDGTLIAKEIETTDDDGGVESDNQFKLVGFVDEMPGTGFNGDWIISGANFVGTNDTQYAESNGLLAEGTYVQVTYEIADNVRKIIRIQTEVPPGAGDVDDTGSIESIGDDGLSAASVEAATAVWRIAGVDYIVSPATHLNDSAAALTIGNMAMVNSYVDESGNNVATSIQGVTLDTNIYLPFTTSQ